VGSVLGRVTVGAAVVALAACGGGSHRAGPSVPPESAACRVLTTAAVDDVRQLLRDYGSNASPADLPFYDLRETLSNVQAQCRVEWLGAAFDRSLKAKQLTRLLSLLPTTYVTYLRQALACARAPELPASCLRAVHSIHSPGATGTGATPHPLVP